MTQQWKKRASAAYSYSLAKLALNSYMFAEELAAWNESDTEEQKEKAAALFRMLGQYLEGQDVLSQIEDLRKQTTDAMEEVVGCTDCFLAYEYALNRVERRFLTGLPSVEMSDEAFTQKLLRYIKAGGNDAEMNRRFQNVVGQLPIRFTRRKFYSMVQEALEIFAGGNKEALDQTIYLLLSGMEYLSGKRKIRSSEFQQALDKLQAVSFQDLTKEGLLEAQETAALAGEKLSALSDFYQILQEMIDDLYVLCLTGKDAVRNVSEEQHCLELLRELCAFVESGASVMPEIMEEKLYALEGVQEQAMEKYARLDPAPEYAEGETQEARMGRRVDRLLSGSAFAVLEDGTNGGFVTAQDVEQAVEKLIAAMDPVLKESQKPVARAVMATALSQLPISFGFLDQTRDYIGQSLASCVDTAEKETCMELLDKIMEMEDYALV